MSMGYSPWGHKESETTERLNTAQTHIPLITLNGGPVSLWSQTLEHVDAFVTQMGGYPPWVTQTGEETGQQSQAREFHTPVVTLTGTHSIEATDRHWGV